MNSQLMLAPSDGSQSIQRMLTPRLDQIDMCQRIQGAPASLLAHSHEVFILHHLTFVCHRKFERCAGKSNGFIALFNFTLAKKSLVRIALGILDAEDHDSSGSTVNSVNGHKRIDRKTILETNKQSLLHESARRNHWQKVWLICDHKMIVLKENMFLKWNAVLDLD